jgi:hypothetical protein
MQGMLRSMVLALGGGDIVGSGGTPPPQSPPETKVEDGPKKKDDKRKAKLKFAASKDGATFECKLDHKQFKPCDSPEKYKVGLGRHKFQVVATALGVADPKPDAFRWTVKRDVGGGRGAGGGGGPDARP